MCVYNTRKNDSGGIRTTSAATTTTETTIGKLEPPPPDDPPAPDTCVDVGADVVWSAGVTIRVVPSGVRTIVVIGTTLESPVDVTTAVVKTDG